MIVLGHHDTSCEIQLAAQCGATRYSPWMLQTQGWPTRCRSQYKTTTEQICGAKCAMIGHVDSVRWLQVQPGA